MKTISFYSYKGGVGRTLALKEMAQRLVEYGKSVMIIDFDLEAPGMPYKLSRYIKAEQIISGIVDYISDFTENGKLGEIEKHIIELPKNNPDDACLYFLPAGNTNVDNYWKKLSRINWVDLFYRPKGYGLRFFLDLKERIRKNINPDFLLIDSRTGITELSGISLRILADEVIMFFVNNEENISGTEKVLSSLFSNKIKRAPLPTQLVLTRIPKPNDKIPSEFKREYDLVAKLKHRFENESGSVDFEINLIHTDSRLQMNEDVVSIGNFEEPIGISAEYIQLFEKLFKNEFTTIEWGEQENKIQAEKYFRQAQKVEGVEKIKLLNKAIGLDSEKFSYYATRGLEYFVINANNYAVDDFKKVISLNPQNKIGYVLLALLYHHSNNNLDEASRNINIALSIDSEDPFIIQLYAAILMDAGKFEEAVEIISDKLKTRPDEIIYLNRRAVFYRKKGFLELALKDIFKAIEINPNGISYIILALIKADQGSIEEFILHLDYALKLGMGLFELRSERKFFEKFRDEPRFVRLLESYNIKSEKIFSDGPIEDVPIEDKETYKTIE